MPASPFLTATGTGDHASYPTAWAKLLAANSTDATFPARAPTTTEPSGVGVITLGAGRAVPPDLTFLFFGAGANDQTFNVRVIGWRKVDGLWVPFLLCQATCTLSSAITGVAGQPVANTDLVADTVSVTNGIGVGTTPVADSLPAYLEVGSKDCQKVEVVFDMTGATSGNALYYAS